MKIYRLSTTTFTPQFTPAKNTAQDLALSNPQEAMNAKGFNVRKMLANRILNKTNAGNLSNPNYQQIVDFYCQRENLPPLQITWFGNIKDPKISGQSIVGQFGIYTDKSPFLKLNKAFLDMPQTMILTIRHEIEHAIDTLKHNYRTTPSNQHHKNYSRFDRQYAHKEILQDAIENQKPVSALAIEHFNIPIPENYTRNGDYYVPIPQ